MRDLISRQAAIDAIRNIKAIKGTSDDKILLVDKAEAMTELMVLPSAEPVRKGEWLDYTCMNWHGWHCSECDYETQKKTRYCPNCGAFMSEGETDD